MTSMLGLPLQQVVSEEQGREGDGDEEGEGPDGGQAGRRLERTGAQPVFSKMRTDD